MSYPLRSWISVGVAHAQHHVIVQINWCDLTEMINSENSLSESLKTKIELDFCTTEHSSPPPTTKLFKPC